MNRVEIRLASSMCDTAVAQECGKDRRNHMRRASMAWNKPKLTEVPVSMEINMYACAQRK